MCRSRRILRNKNTATWAKTKVAPLIGYYSKEAEAGNTKYA
ncbi:hypothetical protein O5274_27490 [Escherichia coli]|nr:hypothetical protein [Escherichia coli]